MPHQAIFASGELGFCLTLFAALSCWFLTAVGLVRARRDLAACELECEQLRAQASQTDLNPHFLFNALNTIRYFVRTDAGKARSLLLDLSDYFKGVVDSADQVLLEEEWERVCAYLNLEQARRGDSLRLELRSEDLPQGFTIPTRVLPPLLALAVEGEPSEDSEDWCLSLSCRVSEAGLEIQIEDDRSREPLPPTLLEPIRGRLSGTGATLTGERGRLLLLFPREPL